MVKLDGDKDKTSDGFRTVLTAALTGFLTVVGTIGAASLAGYFDVTKTEKINSGSIDLEKLKFANELVKTALATDNAANSLLFYADIGLLSGLKVEAIKTYAQNENNRIKSGSQSESILPRFGPFSGQGIWLDRSFMADFAPKAKEEIVKSIITTGNYLLQGFGINKNVDRISNFLGQIAYETAGLSVLTESGDFSSERLIIVFPSLFDAASAQAYANQPEKILSRVYAGKFGNGPEDSGDGFKFRGRGFLQITGRDNYKRLSQQTGIDLISDPNIVGNPDTALLVAAAFWTNAGLNEIADSTGVEAITQKISGSSSGLESKRNFVKRARDLLEKRK